MPVCTLPAGTEAPAVARQFVESWLRRCGYEAISGDALLAVSELVTNAVKHGEPPCTIDVGLHDDGLWIGVSDAAHEPPSAPHVPAGTTAASGRGLLILDRVCSRWGVAPHRGDGKTVWCLVRLPAVR